MASPRARSQSRTRGSGRYYAPSAGGGGGGGGTDPSTLAGGLRWLRAKDGIATTSAYITSVTASSSFGGNPPLRLFLLNYADAWDSNATASGWIKAQLNTGLAVTSYTITFRVGQAARMPKTWTFEGSNDDSSWTTLDTRTNITDWSTALFHTYTFTNATAYTYYRLNVSANNGDTYLSMGALWFDSWVPVQSSAKQIVDALNGAKISTYGSGASIASAATPNSGNALQFSGNNSAFVLGHLDGAALEVWVVIKSTGTSSSHWKMGEVGDLTVYPYTDGKIYEDAGLPSGQRQSFTPSMAINTWRLYRVVNDGTTWQAWLNNTSQLTASGKAVTWPSPAAFLGSTSLQGGALQGQIAELYVRSQKSTAGEVTSLISYFNTEHGLTVT